MGWIILAVAVVLEIAWAMTLKWTEGYTRLVPSLVNFSLATVNLIVLSNAMKLLPTALAYSIWTGLGAVGVTVLAIVYQGEAYNFAKLFCIALIICGVIGLKVVAPS